MTHSISHSIRTKIASLAAAGWAVSLAMGVASPASGDSGGGPSPKKLIAIGWDSPSPKTLLENLGQIEETPFDGVGIQVETKDDAGGRVILSRIFNAVPWKREWFKSDVELLKKVKSKKLTDNFVYIGPGRSVDWFDDAGWKEVLEHFHVAAWIAREGGLKGLMFDPEVGQGKSAFNYSKQDQKAKYSFADYSAKARERGRQVMEALTKEYPSMTLFTLFMNSGTALAALGSDPREGLEAAPYSLYPAFVNGWLDAVPPTMTIVDGAEYAYPHSSEIQYLKHVNAIRNTTLALIAPENRARYRAQVRASLGIYLDAYIGMPVDNVHSDVILDPPLEGRPVDRLQAALTSAQEAADQYVWVWGEQYRWWPTSVTRVSPQTWDQILPGASDALRNAMDPQKQALARAGQEFAIAERKAALRGVPLQNLVQNGAFTEGLEEREGPANWTMNQAGNEKGVMSRDPLFGFGSKGAARLEGVADASLSQEIEVKPYCFYKVRLRVRQMGEGDAVVRLRWLDAEAAAEAQNETTLTPARSPRDGWQLVEGVLRAPSRAARLRVELAASGQKSPDDVIWFDDVELIPVAVN